MSWSMGWGPDGHRTIRPVEQDEFQVISNPDAPAFIYAPPDSREVVLYHAEGFTPDTRHIHTKDVHITEFESIWSSAFRLNPVPPEEATFAPVVDNNWTVVGHLGWADGTNIRVPEPTIRNGRHFWYLLQKKRLDDDRQQLLDDDYQHDLNMHFGDPDLVRLARKNRTVSRYPNPQVDTRLSEAERGPLSDRSIQDTYRIDLDMFVKGGGKASVGRSLLEKGEGLYLPSIPGGVPDERVGSPKTPYSCGWQFLVLVDPEGRIQRVLDVRANLVTEIEQFIWLIGVAVNIWMFLDIVPLAVALLSAGIKIAARVTIRALGMKAVDSVAKELVETAAKEAIALSASKTLTGVAVSARDMTYGVEHVAGRTFILGADMAKVRAAMASIPTEEGVHDLLIHGTPRGFDVLIKIEPNGVKVWRNVSVREVADAVRAKLPPGVQLRLLSCDTGIEGAPAVGLANNEMAAQQLANELNRTVWGADATVLTEQVDVGVNETRKVFIPNWGKLPDGTPIYGKFHEFTPQRGSAALKGNGGNLPANEAAGEINRVHPRPPGPGR